MRRPTGRLFVCFVQTVTLISGLCLVLMTCQRGCWPSPWDEGGNPGSRTTHIMDTTHGSHSHQSAHDHVATGSRSGSVSHHGHFKSYGEPHAMAVSMWQIQSNNSSKQTQQSCPDDAAAGQSHVLVTGAAGFIGFHISKALALQQNTLVLGLDNFNAYYDPAVKRRRQQLLLECCNVQIIQGDVRDAPLLRQLFKCYKLTQVVHMAAQAGVKASVMDPAAYIHNNEVGLATLLQVLVQQQPLPSLVYASSSSVYGGKAGTASSRTRHCNKATLSRHRTAAWQLQQQVGIASTADAVPFKKQTATRPADAPESTSSADLHPTSEANVPRAGLHSVYAATKLASESLTEVFVHQYKIRATGLRFFTVYGPWGRPDMAVMKFTQQLLSASAIKLTCFPKVTADCQPGSFTSKINSRGLDSSRKQLSTNGVTAVSMQYTNNTDAVLLGGSANGEEPPVGCTTPYRDFTYIDDIVSGIIQACRTTAAEHGPWHKIYNLGRGQPASVHNMLLQLEQALGVHARNIEVKVAAAGSPDVFATWADTAAAERDLGFRAKVDLQQGLAMFVEWYSSEYG